MTAPVLLGAWENILYSWVFLWQNVMAASSCSQVSNVWSSAVWLCCILSQDGSWPLFRFLSVAAAIACRRELVTKSTVSLIRFQLCPCCSSLVLKSPSNKFLFSLLQRTPALSLVPASLPHSLFACLSYRTVSSLLRCCALQWSASSFFPARASPLQPSLQSWSGLNFFKISFHFDPEQLLFYLLWLSFFFPWPSLILSAQGHPSGWPFHPVHVTESLS